MFARTSMLCARTTTTVLSRRAKLLSSSHSRVYMLVHARLVSRLVGPYHDLRHSRTVYRYTRMCVCVCAPDRFVFSRFVAVPKGSVGNCGRDIGVTKRKK